MYLFVVMTVMLFGFVSCGGDADEKDLVGTWESTEYDEDGEVYKVTMIFKKDGICINDIGEVGRYSIMTTKEVISKYGAVENLPDGECLILDFGSEGMTALFIKSFAKDMMVLSIDPSEPDIVLKKIK